MKINNQTIVKRWNSVMSSIYREHLTIDTDLSELEYQKKNYNIENGISVKWLLNKAEYVLSTYYEEGHLNNDMRYDEDEHRLWVSETGKLKRLISRLKDMEEDFLVVEW